MNKLEEIRKLPPEKRIQALQDLKDKILELIETGEIDSEEAEQLLEDAERELIILQQTQEKKDIKQAFKIDDLEKELEPKIEEKKLETIAEEAKIQKKEEKEDAYINLLKQKTADEIYGKVKEIYQDFKKTGALTSDQERSLKSADHVLQYKNEIYHGSNIQENEQTHRKMSLAEQMIQTLKGNNNSQYY